MGPAGENLLSHLQQNIAAHMLLDNSALPGVAPLPAAPLAIAGDRDETQPLVDPGEVATALASAFDMVMPMNDADLSADPGEV